MYHYLEMTPREKIKAWLNLCDFTFKLTKDNFSEKIFMDRLEEMRKDKLRSNYSILKSLGKLR